MNLTLFFYLFDVIPGCRHPFSESAIEEERRVAFVGLTRAKKEANISYHEKETDFGALCDFDIKKPSRFIFEMCPDHPKDTRKGFITMG